MLLAISILLYKLQLLKKFTTPLVDKLI